MSVYYQKYKPILELKRSVNGVEEDLDEEEQNANPASQNDDEHMDDNEPANDYNMENEDEENTDEEPTDNEGDDLEEPTDDDNQADDEHADDEDEANDYNMDMDTEDEEPTDDEGDDAEDSIDDDNDASSGEISEDEIKQMEQELFKSVPPEQMAIKVLELKKQYLDAYNTTSNILIRVNKIIKTNDNMKILEFVTNKLIELKDLIKFYMTNTFDTKSFIENNINYQQYLSTLNTINKIFKEIKDKNEDK